MRWFRQKRAAQRGPERRQMRQRSLGLPKLLEPLRRGAGYRYSVLDLGPAEPSNLEFFLGKGALVTVADFYRSSKSEEPFSSASGTPFDLVLAWDVLNYLRPADLGSFMKALTPHFRPGATLHAFIAMGREIPRVPPRYRIEDAETLLLESTEGPRIPAPRYVEPDLLKRMPGLRVEHRFQLRNEMLEYVFSYRPFSVGAGAFTEPSTFSMNSGNPLPIQRTTTTRSFSQSM